MLAAEAAARARDDRYLAVESEISHGRGSYRRVASEMPAGSPADVPVGGLGVEPGVEVEERHAAGVLHPTDLHEIGGIQPTAVPVRHGLQEEDRRVIMGVASGPADMSTSSGHIVASATKPPVGAAATCSAASPDEVPSASSGATAAS